MPPKRKLVYEVKKFKATIDAKKFTEEMKEIAAERDGVGEGEAEDEEEYLLGEEEEEEEFTEEETFPEPEWNHSDFKIDLSFPEAIAEYENNEQCYPASYYTLSTKERLILLAAENFRHQYAINNAKKRPLVLAPLNECGVQKFVSTTIRPVKFMHVPLIADDMECAKFVADFIIYESLEDPLSLPKRLMSPATILRRRCGNSYEMATLLVSLLIGAGFPAMVVSGVAREPVIMNDQRNVLYPYEFPQLNKEEVVKVKEKTGQKYKLRPLPDLESHLKENIEELRREKELHDQQLKDEELKQQLEAMEWLPVDRYHYLRSHAWVVILDNAPWSIRPRKVIVNEQGESMEEPITPRFIEPSTGLPFETSCSKYVLIDSVWNDYNYYANRQKCVKINEIRWDLRNTEDWEHFLPGEPPEMRQSSMSSDDNIFDKDKKKANVDLEKHLDLICSWSDRPHIGMKEFEERFPKLEKCVEYYCTIEERYAPYSQADGKELQLTTYKSQDYAEPLERYAVFKNRADFLRAMKYCFDTAEVEEVFDRGRNDSLKCMNYNVEQHKPKCFHYYHKQRADALSKLEMYVDKVILHFVDRADLCFRKEFDLRTTSFALKRFDERFLKPEGVPADISENIAVRTFLLSQRKIHLQFHYARGALTASSIEFTKPPKPDYGQEITYDVNYAKIYKASENELQLTHLKIYELLLEQLACEDRVIKDFDRLMHEVDAILSLRQSEMINPVLKFRLFDSLRNAAARDLALRQLEEEEERQREINSKPPDFIAPYLIRFQGEPLTVEESRGVYRACLSDIKNKSVRLLNDLQRQYEDMSNEAKSLKRFLHRFQDHFENHEYQQLMDEAKTVEIHKRMMQHRLELTHEDSQKKYEMIKASLHVDPRLNLQMELPQPKVEPVEAETTEVVVEAGKVVKEVDEAEDD